MRNRPLKELSDREVILNFQAFSDRKFLDEIYRRYHRKVRVYCNTILQDREAADDLAQDTFLKVVNNLSKLKNATTFVSWLFQIARNLCLDHLRRQARQKAEKLEEVLELADEIIDVEELEARENQILLMQVLLDELSAEDRALLQLKYLDRVKIKDIQRQYSLSESAVKMRLARARKKIARLLEERMPNRH